MTITQLAAVLGLIGAVGGGGIGGYMYLEGRYAKIEQVGANAQQIAIIKIENAAASGNTALLRRLCDDFRQTHGWTPSACKR